MVKASKDREPKRNSSVSPTDVYNSPRRKKSRLVNTSDTETDYFRGTERLGEKLQKVRRALLSADDAIEAYVLEPEQVDTMQLRVWLAPEKYLDVSYGELKSIEESLGKMAKRRLDVHSRSDNRTIRGSSKRILGVPQVTTRPAPESTRTDEKRAEEKTWYSAFGGDAFGGDHPQE